MPPPRPRAFIAGPSGAWRIEFASADADAFDELLRRLRETEEWTYVEREVEVRLSRG
jgi:hypothetical protein